MSELKPSFEAQDEDAAELSASEALSQGPAPTFCKKTTLLVVEAIRDSASEEQLGETLGHVVSKLLLRAWGHLAFPHGQLNKEFVRAVTQAFKDKVEEYTVQDRSKTATLVKYVVDVIFDAIYDTIKDFQAMHISSMAV